MFLCRSVDELPSPNSDSEAGEGEKNQKSKVPRRRFPWTDETRYIMLCALYHSNYRVRYSMIVIVI